MPTAPRSVADALDYAQAQSRDATEDWTNLCQRFVRSCYGIPALFASAWAQWLGADPEDRHTGAIEDAPVGAALCFRGGEFGHIMLAAHPHDGDHRAWSNDLVRRGEIDIVNRSRPITQWGQEFVGWLSTVNDFDLELNTGRPPKPKQDKPYVRIDRAIGKLEGALETAVRLGDRKDARLLRGEIRDLRELYALLRHA